MTRRRRRPMPAGAGGVRCLDCGATAAATGDGRPIELRHAPGCPNAAPTSERFTCRRCSAVLPARHLVLVPVSVAGEQNLHERWCRSRRQCDRRRRRLLGALDPPAPIIYSERQADRV